MLPSGDMDFTFPPNSTAHLHISIPWESHPDVIRDATGVERTQHGRDVFRLNSGTEIECMAVIVCARRSFQALASGLSLDRYLAHIGIIAATRRHC